MTNDLDNRYGEVDMNDLRDPDVQEFDRQQAFEHLAAEQRARHGGAPVDELVIVALVFLVLLIVLAGYALWYTLQNPTW